MIDAARHFQPVDVIKEILMLWLHENECFHWHLADDQGWRMIENHPKLTKLA
jgi:hexosaminidase